eukprot:CAMPEP_0177634114 /NCGR_PEP_ID=MMETSP0447-20121125/3197_1 /TAXON_ID=0 /ORGANISM="Stygamoeba regulata, Strain BSH-02190019" /LENGTH=216 /DNA_ID=CAMNT_0019135817 /DNA_START=293 /DNA_END=940 /DNA_ORIENTATION=+
MWTIDRDDISVKGINGGNEHIAPALVADVVGGAAVEQLPCLALVEDAPCRRVVEVDHAEALETCDRHNGGVVHHVDLRVVHSVQDTGRHRHFLPGVALVRLHKQSERHGRVGVLVAGNRPGSDHWRSKHCSNAAARQASGWARPRMHAVHTGRPLANVLQLPRALAPTGVSQPRHEPVCCGAVVRAGPEAVANNNVHPTVAVHVGCVALHRGGQFP